MIYKFVFFSTEYIFAVYVVIFLLPLFISVLHFRDIVFVIIYFLLVSCPTV